MKFFCTIVFLSSFAAVADTNEIPALIPAYGEIAPTFWEQHKIIVIIGALLVAALAALVAWNIFRPKPAPVLPPEKIARDALARLQAQPQDGHLPGEVSRILRRYICTVFGLPVNELTTAEFCAAISAQEKTGATLAPAIASFLRECDVRKFSPVNPPTSADAVTRALELISQAEK